MVPIYWFEEFEGGSKPAPEEEGGSRISLAQKKKRGKGWRATNIKEGILGKLTSAMRRRANRGRNGGGQLKRYLPNRLSLFLGTKVLLYTENGVIINMEPMGKGKPSQCRENEVGRESLSFFRTGL